MENTNEINLMDICTLLLKHISKIIIAGIIMAVVSFTYTKTLVVPMYRSDAKMVVKVLSSETLTTYSDVQTAVGVVGDCVEIIKSRQVMQEIIDELELDYTAEQLLTQISISVPEDTRVLKVTVTNPDQKLVKEIAETLCRVSESVVADNIGVDSIRTFEKASTPTKPSSPNALKNTAVGAFFGMFAVSAYIILLKLLNTKIYTQEDVEQMLGLSVFSSIPYIDEDGEKKKNTKVASEKGGKSK